MPSSTVPPLLATVMFGLMSMMLAHFCTTLLNAGQATMLA
jgi:hypothetical protein